MATILIADDDGHIREVVRYALEKAGYSVVEAGNGTEALRLLADRSVDLAILDIVMPGEDGIEICRRLTGGGSGARAVAGKVPVIFLTSRCDEIDRIVGLELGADDYVTKPFSPREVVARVKAVLRRTASTGVDEVAGHGDPAATAAVLSHAALRLDTQRHRCSWQGREIDLTVTEFAILRTLLGMPGKAYSRTELVDRSYGWDHHITERTIDTHIRRIRRKLEEASTGAGDVVETVHGLGYRLRV